jgi:predicted DNA-binding protein
LPSNGKESKQKTFRIAGARVNRLGLPALGHKIYRFSGLARGFANPLCGKSDNYVIMSDMSSERITVRIPQELGGRLRHRSRIKGQTESDLIREALETYLGRSNGERSAFELAEEAGLIGAIRRSRTRPPKDLSTNPRHFKGFGKDQ